LQYQGLSLSEHTNSTDYKESERISSPAFA